MSYLQKEKEIPVFTVWKNNAILKNIFLINNPPNLNDNQENDNNQAKIYQDFEETLLVGRHPDCDIRLEHPSISRFHLRIHSLPSSKLLFLTDLSSVHGTWVSGRRIEPNIRTMVKEGDHLRIGGSSRVYKLHWIPLSLAYDVSKSFVPPLDFPDQQEDEDEIIMVSLSLLAHVATTQAITALDEISVGLKDEEVKIVDNISDDILKGVEPLNLCGRDQMVAEKVLSQAPLLQPQKPDSVKDEAAELADCNFEGLASHCLDDISQELEQKELLLEPLISNKDFENEDVQSMDSILEGLVPLFLGENWEWVALEENYLSCSTEEDHHPESSKDDETGLISPVLEGLDILFLDENSEQRAQKATSSAPLMPDEMESPAAEFVDHIIAEGGQEFVPEVLGDDVQDDKQEFVPEVLGEDVQDNAWSFWSESHIAPSSLATAGSLLTTECHHPGIENGKLDQDSEAEVLSKKISLGSASSDLNSPDKDHQGTELWSFWSGKMGVESVCSALSDAEPFSESEYKSLPNGYLSSPFSSLKRQADSPLISSEQKSARSFWSGRENLESLESENETCESCYQSPKSINSVKERLGSPLMTSDQNPVDSIWLRRGKLASAPQVLTSRTEEKNVKTDQKNVKLEPISKALFHGKNDPEEEEVFTPDKENFTPTTHKSMRKFAILKEINNSSSGKSPLFKMTCSPDNHYVDIISPLSDKENYSPRTKQKKKTARRDSVNQVQSVKLKERKGFRKPFQSLLANSLQKSITECHFAEAETKSVSSVSYANVVTCKEKCAREELRQWKIVVDTTTLLNKESRKALQLLEGLTGTQLIIPRIVITELSSLKRQLSFFKRNTEVLSALEWIQDCMLKTGWWIHVQNSVEDGRPVAPTPPASPQTGSCAFSSFEFRREVLSPTVEDDVLDFAVSFRKTNHDGQLVLLSNDITMKIKAMAEGMICETGEEFRESLVNPFSERFRWTDSSPRGQTWSCADDFVLKEKFYPSSLKMMTPKSRENVKGLKLILLHNSRYHEQMTAIR